MLDFPASGNALWALFDAGGPRPEYVLPVLYAESGFDPSLPNQAGAAYYGINQANPGLISTYANTDPATYLTWPASAQIETVVSGMFRAIVGVYGAIRSGTRSYQANFLPATMPRARSLGSVIASAGDGTNVYAANRGIDTAGKGTITVGDLAAFVGKAARSSAVIDAIAQTYALRPGETPREPVYGEDFGSFRAPGATLGMFAAAASMAFLYYVAFVRRA